MVRSAQFQPNTRSYPDPIRVVAISVSIALNVAMLAFLLRPPEFTIPVQRGDDALQVNWLVPVKPKPIEVTVKPKPTPTTHTTTTTIHHILQKDPPPVITHEDGPMNIAVDPIQPIGPIEPVRPVVTEPIQASLTPIVSPAPTYPLDALRDGITGTVQLELLVGVDGRVLEVHVVRGSGNRELDAAAREQVLRNWRFQPAISNGVAVQALGRLPIIFTLEGR